jgi:hypothetical protein
MKVIYEYDLPEDREENDLHRQAAQMYCALQEIREWFRQKRKYQLIETFVEAEEEFWKIMKEEGIEL